MSTSDRETPMWMWRHEALLSFVTRIRRDSEFREWFVQSPSDALASQGLNDGDLRYLGRVLRSDNTQPELAEALCPFVDLLVEATEMRPDERDAAYGRLTSELDSLGARIAEARVRERSARPWWKFWRW